MLRLDLSLPPDSVQAQSVMVDRRLRKSREFIILGPGTRIQCVGLEPGGDVVGKSVTEFKNGLLLACGFAGLSFLLVLDYLFAPTATMSAITGPSTPRASHVCTAYRYRAFRISHFLQPFSCPQTSKTNSSERVYLLPARKERILIWHFVSVFPLGGKSPRESRNNRDSQTCY